MIAASPPHGRPIAGKSRRPASRARHPPRWSGTRVGRAAGRAEIMGLLWAISAWRTACAVAGWGCREGTLDRLAARMSPGHLGRRSRLAHGVRIRQDDDGEQPMPIEIAHFRVRAERKGAVQLVMKTTRGENRGGSRPSVEYILMDGRRLEPVSGQDGRFRLAGTSRFFTVTDDDLPADSERKTWRIIVALIGATVFAIAFTVWLVLR